MFIEIAPASNLAREEPTRRDRAARKPDAVTLLSAALWAGIWGTVFAVAAIWPW